MPRFTRALRRRRAGSLAIAAVAVAALLPAGEAFAAPPQAACEKRTNNTYEKLLECVRVEGVREHQAAFQAIADANGGTRAAGTPGYDASVDYVVDDPRGGRMERRARRVRRSSSSRRRCSSS